MRNMLIEVWMPVVLAFLAGLDDEADAAVDIEPLVLVLVPLLARTRFRFVGAAAVGFGGVRGHANVGSLSPPVAFIPVGCDEPGLT